MDKNIPFHLLSTQANFQIPPNLFRTPLLCKAIAPWFIPINYPFVHASLLSLKKVQLSQRPGFMLFQQVTNGNGESYIFVCFQFILCSYKKESVGGKRTDSLCMYTWEDALKIFLRICLLSPPRIRLRPCRTSVLASPCPFPLRGMRIQTTIKGEGRKEVLSSTIKCHFTHIWQASTKTEKKFSSWLQPCSWCTARY